MEIIYPEDFIKFYNEDEEIIDVGEFEIVNNFNEVDLILSKFEGYRQSEKLSKTISDSTHSVLSNLCNISQNIVDTISTSTPIEYISSLIPSSNITKTYRNKPLGPPPSYLPSKNDKNVSITKGNLNSKPFSLCINKFTYIWQTNGRSYWTYLILANNKSICGFRWTAFRWIYFGLDLNRINAFVCY
ncbi:hypothetical protein [Clostridium tarantellae]|uniref:Uncharacterized protein n=1 Tax=Clostridium tarantellae TaxID=39493 RepID=A0A6I1MM92_9CLOT|nr:hypothetical protein [Clostridium tarantellae]MPQ43873.1 hypothetical protein [Clostridium tarantellae]